MNNNRTHRIVFTVVYGILLVVLYSIIFLFSAQDGDASGNLSMRFAGKCAELFSNISGKHWTGGIIGETAAFFEHPLRKLAHFTEYACMGALVYLLWSLWVERRGRLYLICIAWVFLSAGADELHQLFVPGRYGSFADVCLDTLGGAAGVAAVWIFQKLSLRLTRRRKRHESHFLV